MLIDCQSIKSYEILRFLHRLDIVPTHTHMAFYYSPFRKEYTPKQDAKICPFCDPRVLGEESVRDLAGKVIENDSYIWLVNFFPKFEGHTMIVPKRHILSLTEESEKEVVDRHQIINKAVETLRKAYPEGGVEIFLQFGDGSQSSVPHLHWHVVPALPQDPLRSFEKLGQFHTPDEKGETVLRFPIEIQHVRGSLLDLLAKTLDSE